MKKDVYKHKKFDNCRCCRMLVVKKKKKNNNANNGRFKYKNLSNFVIFIVHSSISSVNKKYIYKKIKYIYI